MLGQSIFQRAAYKASQKRTSTIANTRVRFLVCSMCVMPLDHHLTTPSSQPVPCIVCTSQHSFITTTTSAGNCAHYTISGALSCYFPVRHSSPTRLLRPTTLLPKALGVTIFFRAKYISIFHLFFSIILHDSKPLLINDLCAFWFFPVNSDIAADAYPSILACLLFMCYSKRNKESRIVASHDLIAHLR